MKTVFSKLVVAQLAARGFHSKYGQRGTSVSMSREKEAAKVI